MIDDNKNDTPAGDLTLDEIDIAMQVRRIRKENRALFARDGYVCMYCGDRFAVTLLTRDHIAPRSRGGLDRWDNVITACKACNNKKDDMTPHEAGMPLLAVPYVPNRAEYLILKNRHILVDQMDFLSRHIPKSRQGL